MDPFSWTCAYCGQPTTITDPNHSITRNEIYTDKSKFGRIGLFVKAIACPNPDCGELTLTVSLNNAVKNNSNFYPSKTLHLWPLLPRSCAKPQPEYIPEAIRQDYEEACLILNDSPKASATLSRRCLQGIVRDFWKIPTNKRGNLGAEINFIKDELPEDTWDAIQAIRNTGDIGAHMQKDVNCIVDVEPDEAELLIRLIESLLEDWYIERHHREQRHAKTKALSLKKQREQKDAKKASKEAKTATPPIANDDGTPSL